jgi:hypothetical protein
MERQTRSRIGREEEPKSERKGGEQERLDVKAPIKLRGATQVGKGPLA